MDRIHENSPSKASMKPRRVRTEAMSREDSYSCWNGAFSGSGAKRDLALARVESEEYPVAVLWLTMAAIIRTKAMI